MERLSYDETVRFHGHDGPFLALGYRAGEWALRTLRPEGIMDIECQVETIDSKPYTCVMDGIQCSTPCTVGKGTLSLKKTGLTAARITLLHKKTEERIVLTVKSNIAERALQTQDLHKEAARIREEAIDSLFEIESRE